MMISNFKLIFGRHGLYKNISVKVKSGIVVAISSFKFKNIDIYEKIDISQFK